MDIVGKKKLYFTISGVAMLLGLAFMIYYMTTGQGAFNYDVEFTGGTDMTVNIGKDFNTEDIAKLITDTVGEASPQVQSVIGTNHVAIKMKSIDSESRTKVKDAIKAAYGVEEGDFEVADISASISREMQRSAILAILCACAGMLLYVTIRFRDFKTGASAVLALLHDSILVVLSYAVFRIPLNYSFIAVVLTILGFSINATIVIFDRVRENRRRLSRPTTEELMNTSISQTIKRCIYTSLTVLIVTLCLYVLGVPSIRDFTLPIMVGIIWGTYSSIFLAGSLYCVLSGRRQVKKPV